MHANKLSQLITFSLALVLAACAVAPPSALRESAEREEPHTSKRQIKVNQVGYLPDAQKLAVVPAVAAREFLLINVSTGKTVYRADLSEAEDWPPAQESVKRADFSAWRSPGEYQLRLAGLPDSARFRIAADIYRPLNAAAIKAFYFNRASTALLQEHAGVYARAAGHPDDHVAVHSSAASAARPAGTFISAAKGWYDAGDYNKYIVNSGISTYTLLMAFEQFPAYYQSLALNIPESTDAVPDLLNEVMWNLEWMLAMQDPNDGGVYHKLTDKQFDGMVMPGQTGTQRYVVQKSTAATLDFAAVMAVASRVYSAYETEYPGLAARMLDASKAAWQWAQAHPAATYQQPDDIKTGGYGDENLADEFAWAAAELYIATGNDAFYRAIKPAQTYASVPSWGDVSALVWMSLAQQRKHLTPIADQALITQRIEQLADTLLTQQQNSAYGVSMTLKDFVWGSNAVALNQGMMLLQAYLLKGTPAYLDAAQSSLDYVLGRNATDYSFVTGNGSRTPQHIHHRPSQADAIAAPVPGFIAGGPQAGQQDAAGCPVSYASNLPAKSYLDDACSYASNEVAINWNAPLVYVSGALQALSEQTKR